MYGTNKTNARLRDFLFRCRYGFRGVPLRAGQWTIRVDESLRRWNLDLEHCMHEAMARILQPGDTFVDVGANFGLHTLYAANLVGTQGRVFAFEPVPANVRLLTRNVKLNGMSDRVRVMPAAVSNSPQPTLTMCVPRQPLPLTASLGGCAELHDRVDVTNVRLDDIAADQDLSPKLIKIDVEGAELDVLQGACSLLERCRPSLLIEVHAFALPQFGADLAQFMTYLQAMGYAEQRFQESYSRDDYFQSLFQPQ